MTSVSVLLLTECIGFAREILTKVIMRFVETRTSESRTSETDEAKPPCVQDRVLDKESLKNIIDEAGTRFERLLERNKQEIIDEIRWQKVVESVHEVQARVAALRVLLNNDAIDHNISMQLVISTLNPLQVSLEVAKLRLADANNSDMWEACYIIGTSTLISGYAFLGQDVPNMRTDLLKVLTDIQKRILDDVAANMVRVGDRIPWDDVPKLLSLDGAGDLVSLYHKTSSPNSNLPSQPGSPVVMSYLESMSVVKLREVIPSVEDVSMLNKLLKKEKDNKNRPSAVEVIESRIQQIKSQPK